MSFVVRAIDVVKLTLGNLVVVMPAKAANAPTLVARRTSNASRASISARGPRLDPIGEAGIQARPVEPLDSGFHWKLLLRFQYFRHPWRSRRNDRRRADLFGRCFPKYLVLATAVMALAISSTLFAGSPPDSIFGNYAGAGTCPPGSANSCTDTSKVDNIFIRRLEEKIETDEDRQIRELLGKEKADVRAAFRILRGSGSACIFDGELFWAGDHLAYRDAPPYGQKICKLQLWFKDGSMVVRDPGKACGWKFCVTDKPVTLEGRHFQKAPDQLLATYNRKSVAPPPAAVFGKYIGTGRCPPDSLSQSCPKKRGDHVVVKPGEMADARVVVERGNARGDRRCSFEGDMVWLGDHLAFVKEITDRPGEPRVLQLWFEGDNLVVRSFGGFDGAYCDVGVGFEADILKKAPSQPHIDSKR